MTFPLLVLAIAAADPAGPKVSAPGLTIVGPPFTVRGDAVAGVLGDPVEELSGTGVRFLSGEDSNKDGDRTGSVRTTVSGVSPKLGRWYRFRIKALADSLFLVENDDLTLKLEFFKDGGTNPLDGVTKSIYPAVVREARDLKDAGRNRSLGPHTWRQYTLDVRTPFPDVDTLTATVAFGHGVGKKEWSEFWVSEIEIAPIPDPADYAPPAKAAVKPTALATCVPLGGRWYFDPRGGSQTPPKQFDHATADRLLYLSDRLEAPFAGNMSAVLRKGFYAADGAKVEEDKLLPDNVVIAFTATHLVVTTRNIPNHPTAVFPDRARYLDGNPNAVRESRSTYRIPLAPKPNPARVAMTPENRTALPMGPVGIAVNGVVFFNPYDHIADGDAVWRLDRCCGHPSPTGTYHYHKYPACVNTPWDDAGDGHSPLIGFAFDGYPVYGPYEAAGVLAKDLKVNPLNEFNLHDDPARGPHYHVTPGKYPHILGGYWGVAEPRGRGPR